jgi:AraC-like DNA-binding protein
MSPVVLKRPRPPATAHISGVAAIPAVLESLGARPAKVFGAAGVDLALFDDPENLIALTALGHLVKVCVEKTGCQHFGLLVGQRGGLQSLGLVGLVVRFSPDVATALRRLGQYMHLYHGGQITALVEDEGAAILTYDLYEPGMEAAAQIGDGAVAILCNVMRALCGPDWHPREVHLARRKPADVRPFRRFFRAPLLFEATQDALVMPSHWLTRRLPDVDAGLQRLLQSQIDDLEARHGDDFPELVRSVLRTGLLTGHASADQVAALFSIHSRTLSRRLGAHGTSFKALADEGRCEIAMQMLRDTSLDVREIALSLDYADASAFTRAFRRWTRTTPAAWRAARARSARGNPARSTA